MLFMCIFTLIVTGDPEKGKECHKTQFRGIQLIFIDRNINVSPLGN
jgi:hypothetical protein